MGLKRSESSGELGSIEVSGVLGLFTSQMYDVRGMPLLNRWSWNLRTAYAVATRTAPSKYQSRHVTVRAVFSSGSLSTAMPLAEGGTAERSSTRPS